MSRLILAMVLAISAASGTITTAATPGFAGTERGFWDTHSVVVARVVKVSDHSENPEATGDLTVSVVSVLATDQPVEVGLTLPFASGGALLDFVPKPDQLYALCIIKVNGTWRLPGHAIEIFPSGTCAEKLRDLNDNALGLIENRLRWAREKYFALRFSDDELRQKAILASPPNERKKN